MDITTIALPSVQKIDITAAQYGEFHGDTILTRAVSKEGQWLPHNINVEPHYAITFKALQTKAGQVLVLEQNHLQRDEGIFAKYKIQMSAHPVATTQTSLNLDTLNMAQKYSKLAGWERDYVKYSYYQSSAQYKTLKEEWSKVQNKLDKVFATQKLYPEKSKFLTAFGQPERKTVCACERPESVALDQSLQLMNGEYIKEKLKRVVYNKKLDEAENIKQLYLSAYSRSPKKDELKIATDHLKKSTNKDEALRDLYWVVINSNEFVFQH